MAQNLHGKLGIYGVTPIFLLQDRRVKPTSIKVYIAISSFQGTNETAFPSIEKITDRAGINRKSVISAIKNLIETGWLERKRRPNKSSLYKCLTYFEPVEEFKDVIDKRRENTPPKNDKQTSLFDVLPEDPEVPKIGTTGKLEVPNNGTTGSTKQWDFPYSKRPLVKDQLFTLFQNWNEIPGLRHSKESLFDEYIKAKHRRLVEKTGYPETEKAMLNYSKIMPDDNYWFDYNWPFWDFIARGLQKFVDDAKPLEVYLIKKPKIEKEADADLDWVASEVGGVF